MYSSSSHPVQQSNLQTLTSEQTGSVRTNAVKAVALAFASTLSALLLLLSEASAGSFSFSTGDPDAKTGGNGQNGDGVSPVLVWDSRHIRPDAEDLFSCVSWAHRLCSAGTDQRGVFEESRTGNF